MAHVLANELKATILHAAMSGRLTTRNVNDTPVYDTLKEIKQDRDNRVLKKEIKKDKRLCDKVISDGRFDIPDTWKWTTLGALLYKLTDGTHRTPKYTTDGVKFVSVKDMSSGVLSLENTKFISESEHKELFARCNPQKGDIILSKVGTTGVPAIVDTDEPFSLFVSVALLKFNDALVNRQFLYRLIMSPDIQQQAAENTRGIGNKNWVLDEIANTEIPLPPIEEQARIVARVDELMAKIDEYEKIENKLVELKKNFPGDMKAAVLQAAMQGNLTEQLESDSNITLQKYNHLDEDAIPFDIPESWIWCSLKNVANNIGGFAFKSTDFIEKGTRVIRISDFNEFGFVNNKIVRYEYNDKLSNYLIQNHDILMCMTGGTVGKNYYVQDLKEDCLLNQRVACIRAKNVDSEYLKLVIKSPFIQQLIVNNKNSTNDNISMDLINNFPIPLPPIEEQKRIVEKFDQLLPLCEELEKEIA